VPQWGVQCGPTDPDQLVAGAKPTSFDVGVDAPDHGREPGWVRESNGVISTTPFGPGTPRENVNAARVMYAAVLRFGSDGFTPFIGEYLR